MSTFKITSAIDWVKFENSYIFLMLQVFIFIVDVIIGNANVKNAGRVTKNRTFLKKTGFNNIMFKIKN